MNFSTNLLHLRRRLLWCMRKSSGDAAASACQKSPGRTFLTASAAEYFDFIKILLRPKSLKIRLFCGGLLDHEAGLDPLVHPRYPIFDTRIIVF